MKKNSWKRVFAYSCLAALFGGILGFSCIGCLRYSKNRIKRELSEAKFNQEVFDRVAVSTVLVETDHSWGSGTIVATISNVSFVLTCAHVVRGTVEGSISVNTFMDNNVHAVVFRVDETVDLALLIVPKLNAPVLPIATREPILYEHLFAVSSPLGKFGTPSDLLLAAKNPFVGSTLWRLTGFVYFGSSGGTIANSAGELVCIPKSVETGQDDTPLEFINYCVSLPAIRTFLHKSGL